MTRFKLLAAFFVASFLHGCCALSPGQADYSLPKEYYSAPVAVAGGISAPLVCSVRGASICTDLKEGKEIYVIPLVPLGFVGGLVVGSVKGIFLVGTGVFDMVTLNYFKSSRHVWGSERYAEFCWCVKVVGD